MPFDNGSAPGLSAAADGLLKAAEIVEARHAKGIRATLYDGVLHHCALGALDHVLGYFSDDNEKAVQALAGRILAAGYKSRYGDDPAAAQHEIALWNNADERTGPEVAAMMRHAAQFV